MRESVAAFVVFLFGAGLVVGINAFTTWLIQWIALDTFSLHVPFWPVFLLCVLGASGKILEKKARA